MASPILAQEEDVRGVVEFGESEPKKPKLDENVPDLMDNSSTVATPCSSTSQGQLTQQNGQLKSHKRRGRSENQMEETSDSDSSAIAVRPIKAPSKRRRKRLVVNPTTSILKRGGTTGVPAQGQNIDGKENEEIDPLAYREEIDLVDEEESGSEESDAYGEHYDEDSNDESNWRNEYPEENEHWEDEEKDFDRFNSIHFGKDNLSSDESDGAYDEPLFYMPDEDGDGGAGDIVPGSISKYKSYEISNEVVSSPSESEVE